MAFRAYFIRKSFTGIRKGQGRAFARPWPCVGGSASGNNAFRCIHSGSIRTNAARIVHIGDDLCTVHAGGKAHFVRQRGTACASGTEDENIVPGARPGLYVFCSTTVKRALCTALYSLTWAVMVYCAAVLSIAPPTDWIQPVLQMICCKGHPPSA